MHTIREHVSCYIGNLQYGFVNVRCIPLNKIKFLIDANSELLAEVHVGDFIKQSTELRK
jgi:hypothetical protein